MAPRSRSGDEAAFDKEAAARAGRDARPFRGGCFGRLPGWHAHEVTEAIRHVEGGKEAIRDIRAELVARLTEPAVAEQRHLELLAAQLLPHLGADPQRLAQAIVTCRLAASMSQLAGIQPLSLDRPLRVLPSEFMSPREAGA